MNVHLLRFGRARLCATLLLLAPSAGQAAMLLPGTAIPLTNADILSGPAGTLEATIVQPLMTADFTGSLTTAVLRNSGGTLDFYYQVANDSTSIDSLSRETNSRFVNLSPLIVYSTEVFFRVDDAGLPGTFVAGSIGARPFSADRSANAGVVGFNFIPPPLSPIPGEGIDPGETSRILVIRTNATTFAMNGIGSVIDGTTESVTTFGPVAPIPEPASLFLLSSAFGAAGYLARHRVRREKRRSANDRA